MNNIIDKHFQYKIINPVVNKVFPLVTDNTNLKVWIATKQSIPNILRLTNEEIHTLTTLHFK